MQSEVSSNKKSKKFWKGRFWILVLLCLLIPAGFGLFRLSHAKKEQNLINQIEKMGGIVQSYPLLPNIQVFGYYLFHNDMLTAIGVNLNKVYSIKINSNDLNDEFLEKFEVFEDLSELHLESNQITNRGIENLSSLPKLNSLILQHVLLDDDLGDILIKSPNLYWLSLIDIKLSDQFVEKISSSNLYSLGLHDSLITDKSLAFISKMPFIHKIDVSSCNITNQGLERLQNMRYLHTVNVASTGINDAALRSLVTNKNLAELDLSDNDITDSGVEHLKKAGLLYSLSLSDTRITDRSLDHLSKIPFLETLNLNNTEITDKGLQKLETVKYLKSLSLKNTKVTKNGLDKLRKAKPQLVIISD